MADRVRRRPIVFDGVTEGIQRRDLVSFSTGRLVSSTTNKITVSESLKKRLVGVQETVSSTHPAWKTLSKGAFRGDIGGPFSTTKTWVSVNGGSVFLDGSATVSQFNKELVYYNGFYWAISPADVVFPPSNRSSNDALNELGATAISRCSPSNPTADLTETIGEIFKEGIPSLAGSLLSQWRSLSNRERRRAIGKEYLNVEFGWMPFVRSLQDLSRAIVTADLILSQYERNSGRLVRRSYEFPPETTVVTSVFKEGTRGYHSSASSNLWIQPAKVVPPGQVTRTRKSSVRRWFDGAFTYYVPPAHTGSLRTDIARQVIFAKKILGLSLTPDNIWNLAPWSWAVDWFANVGDVLNNWSNWAIDNQVLAYGYLMEHSSVIDTYTLVGPTDMQRSGVRPFDVVVGRETKLRIQATPYGFGLNWDDFSDRQKAIVAALGISKSK